MWSIVNESGCVVADGAKKKKQQMRPAEGKASMAKEGKGSMAKEGKGSMAAGLSDNDAKKLSAIDRLPDFHTLHVRPVDTYELL